MSSGFLTEKVVMDWGQSNREWNDAEANKLPEKVKELEEQGVLNDVVNSAGRTRVVVVGLGMVGIAFM